MPIIKCPECGKETSSLAEKCPHCGVNPNLKSETLTKLAGVVLVALIAVWFFSGSDEKAPEVKAPAHPLQDTVVTSAPTKQRGGIKISAVDLYKQYEKNEVEADEILKDKIIEISGRVVSIDKSFMDNIIINLATPNQFNSARMEMLDSEKEQAMKIKKGEKVTMRCDKMSRILGAPAGSDCVFYTEPVNGASK